MTNAREIEFEFVDDGGGGGQFRASGNVIESIRSYLASGHIDAAAKLFASCTENIGDRLLQDIRAGSSSESARAATEMFYKARDFKRAAICAEDTGNFAQAARCYEAEYDLEKAAAYYVKAGEHGRAAALYEKNLDYATAGDLYFQMKEYLKAAENWERAGNYLNAGKLYLKMSRWDKAVAVLQKIDAMSGHFVDSSRLLGQVYERSGREDLAMIQYAQVVRGRGVDEETVEVYYRLSQALEKRQKPGSAAKLLQRIHQWNPAFKDVSSRMQQLVAGPGQMPAPQQANPEDLTPVLDGEVVDDAPEDDAKPITMVGVDPYFEFLQQLPLFKELSLEELKYIHARVDRMNFADGDLLIMQGSPGTALFVILEGRVRVSTRSATGAQTVLVELGPGSHVGEMALIDEAPTSADVQAVGEVVAFRLSRQRFDNLLQSNDRIALRFYRTFVQEMTQRLRNANQRLAQAR